MQPERFDRIFLGKEFGPVKEMVLGSDAFLVNEYGNIINQITVGVSFNHGGPPVHYRAETTASPDGKFVAFSRWVPHNDSVALYLRAATDYFSNNLTIVIAIQR